MKYDYTDPYIVKICEVLSTEDPQAGDRIKVRSEPRDGIDTKVKDLPFVQPLLPKFMHVKPKVGECVMVLNSVQGDDKGNRFYLGPLISQAYRMDYDPYNYSSRVFTRGNRIGDPLPNPSMDSANNGTLPDEDDIALVGRKNADIILKDNEVRIRCGYKASPDAKPKDSLVFNDKDLAYIQMKYMNTQDKEGNAFSSSINVVADRINLLSHDSPVDVKLTDPKDLIDEPSLQDIIEKCHPLVYGDELIEFLKKLVEIIRTHTHPFPMQPPAFTTPMNDTLNTNLDKMLSASVRTN